LWMGDDIAVGAVVAATMLVFRLDAMSAWIIGVITIFSGTWGDLSGYGNHCTAD
jgi:hypothetical protein